MTHWDDIYKNYEKGGEAWATLAEAIQPSFMAFVDQVDFPVKHALDIGCGTGKYLQYLHDRGFVVDGIDNSETAARMTRDVIPDAKVFIRDMYECDIPAATYDLIVSVSTIHHGTKKQVASLVRKIHSGLVHGGHIFITLPEWNRAREQKMFHTHEVLAPGTLAPLTGPEAGLAHSFYTEEEIRELFGNFTNLGLVLDEYKRWVISGSKYCPPDTFS